jgi:nucleoside-diphosphate-sugar epimerase
VALALVTGGTGFLGRPLVEALLQRGRKVRVLGRRVVARWRHNPNLEHLRADISQPGVLEEALESVDSVFHLAAATSGRSWDVYYRTTVEATGRLLELFAQHGGGRVVLVSSSGIHDMASLADGLEADEDWPLETNPDARGFYTKAKLLADLAAQKFLGHPSVRLTIVRPGLIYGPAMGDPLGNVTVSIRGKLVLNMPDRPVPLVYVGDVVAALLQIEADERSVGRSYNLVRWPAESAHRYIALYRQLSGDNRRMLALPMGIVLRLLRAADAAARLFGLGDRHLERKARVLSAGMNFSGRRAAKELGVLCPTALTDGIERMLRRMH